MVGPCGEGRSRDTFAAEIAMFSLRPRSSATTSMEQLNCSGKFKLRVKRRLTRVSWTRESIDLASQGPRS